MEQIYWTPLAIAEHQQQVSNATKRLARLEDRRRRQLKVRDFYTWSRLGNAIVRARRELRQLETCDI